MPRFNVGDEIVVVYEHPDDDQGSGSGEYFRVGDEGTIVEVIHYVYDEQRYRIKITHGHGCQRWRDTWWCHESEIGPREGYAPMSKVERKIKLMWERQPFVKRLTTSAV